jgi:hypothetical protein
MSETASEPNPRRKWTILVYQAGDNNLSEECVFALKEMKKVGTANRRDSERDVNLIVQFDPAGRGNPARVFDIKAAGGDGTLEDDIDFEFDREIDSSNPLTLIKFLAFNIRKFPADHYMVVLSGHGAGFFEGFFLQDEERPLTLIPSSFPVTRLKEVFSDSRVMDALDGRNIDILGFDSCMMSTVEVCYEMRQNDHVLDLLIGSEGFSLNSGWPLGEILAELNSHAGTNPTQLANFIVRNYSDFYSDYHLGGLSVDQSAIKLRLIRNLKEQIDDLAQAMIECIEAEGSSPPRYSPRGRPFQDAILLAHWAAQSYNGEQCVDLFDFCELLQVRLNRANPLHENVWRKCADVMSLIAERVILKTCTNGSAFQFSRGVSIYFPWARLDLAPSYEKLDFAESVWFKFLKIYLEHTQRSPLAESKDNRSTPPTSKGPEGRIHSMRNPPTRFPVKHCSRADQFVQDN